MASAKGSKRRLIVVMVVTGSDIRFEGCGRRRLLGCVVSAVSLPILPILEESLSDRLLLAHYIICFFIGYSSRWFLCSAGHNANTLHLLSQFDKPPVSQTCGSSSTNAVRYTRHRRAQVVHENVSISRSRRIAQGRWKLYVDSANRVILDLVGADIGQ